MRGMVNTVISMMAYPNNGARYLMRNLSRTMESGVSEMTGGSKRNYSNTSMLFLAKTVFELCWIQCILARNDEKIVKIA